MGALGGGAGRVPAHVRFDDLRRLVMTGAALFFLAAAWAVSPRLKTAAAMVAIAAGFKLVDALLLGLPVLHERDRQPHLGRRGGGRGLHAFGDRHHQQAAGQKPLGQGSPGGPAERPGAGIIFFPWWNSRPALRHASRPGNTRCPLLRADRRRALFPDGSARAPRAFLGARPAKAKPGACAGPAPSPSPYRSAPWW